MRWRTAPSIFTTENNLLLELIQETNSKQASHKEAEHGRSTGFLSQQVVATKTLHELNGRLEKLKAEKSMEGYVYVTHCQEATESHVVIGCEIALGMVCSIYIPCPTHLLLASVVVRVQESDSIAQITDSHTSTRAISSSWFTDLLGIIPFEEQFCKRKLKYLPINTSYQWSFIPSNYLGWRPSWNYIHKLAMIIGYFYWLYMLFWGSIYPFYAYNFIKYAEYFFILSLFLVIIPCFFMF